MIRGQAPRAGWRARLLLIGGGLAAGVLVVVLVEAALRTFGVASLRRDTLAGFSLAPIFERGERPDGTAVYRTSVARRLPHHEEFSAEKPAGGFRVFVVGESSAAGVPYPATRAFSAFLRDQLAAELPDVPLEVVNAAVPAYASPRILGVVREIAHYAPDLLIIYAGHNEYAERRFFEREVFETDPRLLHLRESLGRLRLFALAEAAFGNDAPKPVDFDEINNAAQMFAVGIERMAGKESLTPTELAYGEMHYRFNVEEMVREMHGVGAEVVLVTLGQNLADWAPGVSSHRADLSPQEVERFDRHLREGVRRASLGDPAGALEEYAAAEKLDDSYALLHFEMANAHRMLGDMAAARGRYLRASDLDRVPHGAPSRLNAVLREVAAQEKAMLVDAEAALAQESPAGMVGDDLFVDMMHPNVRANQVIAGAIAAELRRQSVPRPMEEWQVGAYTPPRVEQLYRADPSLEREEHLVRAVACTLARRDACALRELDIVLAREPQHQWAPKLRAAVARRQPDGASHPPA